MVDVAAEEPINRRGGKEAHFQAAIVATCETRFAGVADDTGFNCNSITNFEVRNRRVGCKNNAGRLVAEDVSVFDDHRANTAGMPKVNIGARNRIKPMDVSKLDYGKVIRTHKSLCS